jgi:hypothetical protein
MLLKLAVLEAEDAIEQMISVILFSADCSMLQYVLQKAMAASRDELCSSRTSAAM